MSGWLWIVGAVVGWLVFAGLLAFGLGAAVRAAERRERRRRSPDDFDVPELDDPRDDA